MTRSALVFAGGHFEDSTLAFIDAPAFDDIWCADGGVIHAHACGLVPNVIVGDCDSAPPQAIDQALNAGARLIKHPVDKNASDLELTLRELADAHYASVTLLAASGGRSDHALFNWLLVLQQDWPFQLTVVDNTVSAYLVHSDIHFKAPIDAGTVVSLVARESVSGVNTQGLQYALTDARISGGSTLGLSNLADGSGNVCVSVDTGRLLVCVVHQNAPERIKQS